MKLKSRPHRSRAPESTETPPCAKLSALALTLPLMHKVQASHKAHDTAPGSAPHNRQPMHNAHVAFIRPQGTATCPFVTD